MSKGIGVHANLMADGTVIVALSLEMDEHTVMVPMDEPGARALANTILHLCDRLQEEPTYQRSTRSALVTDMRRGMLLDFSVAPRSPRANWFQVVKRLFK